MRIWKPVIATLALLSIAAATPPSVADARASLSGTWRGKLEYRDYKADKWFGLPVTVSIELVGDRLTLIRRAAFDDGPKVGLVYITSVGLFYPATGTEQVASYRAERPVTLETVRLKLTAATDADHWTLVEEIDGEDDDRPARIRETTTRDGATLTTLKEVDFTDDTQSEWLTRNRTTLTRVSAKD